MKSKKNLSSSISITIPLVVLLIIEVYFAILFSSKGTLIAQLEQENNALLEENEKLTNSLVTNTSLAKVSQTAETMGLTKPENFLYPIKDETVAKVP